MCFVYCLEGGRSAVIGAGGFRKDFIGERLVDGQLRLRWAEMGMGSRDGKGQRESSEQRRRGQSSWGTFQMVCDFLPEWWTPEHHKRV